MAATFLDNFNGAANTLIWDHAPDIGTGPYIFTGAYDSDTGRYGAFLEGLNEGGGAGNVMLDGSGGVKSIITNPDSSDYLYLYPTDVPASNSFYYEVELSLGSSASSFLCGMTVRTGPLPETNYEYWESAEILLDFTVNNPTEIVFDAGLYGPQIGASYWDLSFSRYYLDWDSNRLAPVADGKVVFRVEADGLNVKIFVNGVQGMFMDSPDGSARLSSACPVEPTQLAYGMRFVNDGYADVDGSYKTRVTRLEFGPLPSAPQAFWTNRVNTTEQDS